MLPTAKKTATKEDKLLEADLVVVAGPAGAAVLPLVGAAVVAARVVTTAGAAVVEAAGAAVVVPEGAAVVVPAALHVTLKAVVLGIASGMHIPDVFL
jgi:hypothetical protein